MSAELSALPVSVEYASSARQRKSTVRPAGFVEKKLAGPTTVQRRVRYPDSDGEPMAENTKQLQYITYVYDSLTVLFKDEPKVFVAADLFWYPVQWEPGIRYAPDVMVAMGRPQGHRGSYRQWDENGQAPQFVMEILSPGNRAGNLRKKSEFYYRHGAEEYVIYDPDRGKLRAYTRGAEGWQSHGQLVEWKSRILGVTFRLDGKEMFLLGPGGKRLMTHLEVHDYAEQEKRRADQEVQARQLAEQQNQRLQAELAQLQALLADQRAD